jgi:integrase
VNAACRCLKRLARRWLIIYAMDVRRLPLVTSFWRTPRRFSHCAPPTKVVKRLLKKTGIQRHSSGAHLLRHTVASQMVCRGASFKEVADVFGHQSLQTTHIYAKLDLTALAQVALRWPGGAQ